MGKNKKKSKSKNNEKTEQNKDQTEKETSQVEKEESVSDSSDLNKSTMLEEESETKKFTNTESQNRRSIRENEEGTRDRKHTKEFYNSNSQSSHYNKNNEPITLRKSDPNRRQNREFGEEDRRDRHKKRFSLNDNGSNKRTRDDSNSRNNYKSPKEENGEFRLYNEELRSHHGDIDYTKIEEKVQDLFEMPKDYSLAHCVAEDMNMGSGIAVQFRRDFRKVDTLLNQRQKTGGLAILEDKNRFIYYLVTKRYSYGKPTLGSLFSSLQKLKQHIIEHDVKKLAIPKIGCGLDRLEWTEVKFMVEFLFRDVDIEIVVCMLEPMEDSPQKRIKNCKVSHETYPIHKIENNTVIIYFSSEEGEISEEMNKLDEKFHFLREFRLAGKKLGNVVFFNKNENYLLCGCIVRKNKEGLFDYEAFQKCLSLIIKENRKYQFYFVAFQTFEDSRDTDINYKIINLLRNTLNNVEVYVCWPGELQKLMSLKDRSSTGSIESTPERSSYDDKSFTKKTYSSNDNWRTRKDNERSSNSFQQKNEKEERSSRNQSYRKNNDDSYKENTSSFCQANEDYWNDEKSSRNQSHWGSSNDSYKGNTSSFSQEENCDEYQKGQPLNIQRNTDQIVDNWENDQHQNEASETDTSSFLSTEIATPEMSYTQCSNKDDEPAIPIQSTKVVKSMTNLNPEVPSFQPRQQIEKPAKVDSEPLIKKNEPKDSDGFEQFQKELEAKKINLTLIKEYDCLPKSVKNYSRVCFGRDDLIIDKVAPESSDVSSLIGPLLNQRQTVGSITYVKEDTNYFYCLITNTMNTSANLLTVFLAVQKLYKHVESNSIRCLVVPKMDNTKDVKFDWRPLKYIFQYVFKKSRTEIYFISSERVYNETFLNRKFGNKLIHKVSPIHQMKEKSIIIYLASLDGYVNKEMNSLVRKFNNTNFFEDFKKRISSSVDHIIRDDPNKDYVLFGCLVRKSSKGPIDFEVLQKCMQKINEENQKVRFNLVGIQAVEIADDESASLKAATVMLHTLQNVSIMMCWPGNLKNKMPVSHK